MVRVILDHVCMENWFLHVPPHVHTIPTFPGELHSETFQCPAIIFSISMEHIQHYPTICISSIHVNDQSMINPNFCMRTQLLYVSPPLHTIRHNFPRRSYLPRFNCHWRLLPILMIWFRCRMQQPAHRTLWREVQGSDGKIWEVYGSVDRYK